jgi:hypothetical protein
MIKSVIVWVTKQKFIYPNKVTIRKGDDSFMTNNEVRLINIIRDHNHPEQALITAIETTLLYLTQLESSVRQVVADSRELA